MAEGVKMKAKHIVLVIISLFICVGLFGQNAGEAAAPAAPASQGYSIVQVFVDSGNWAYAILLVFIIGLVYAIVRWNQLYRKEKIKKILGVDPFTQPNKLNYQLTILLAQLKEAKDG
jgi:hypothetical protein